LGLFVTTTAIYLLLAIAPLAGSKLGRLKPWIMLVGGVPTLWWCIAGVLASIDLTPLVPLAVYSAAVTLAFDEASRRDEIGRNASGAD
jgi:predicted lysophospholipase L1 biosynthesis ABC-type transport system permease subunit